MLFSNAGVLCLHDQGRTAEYVGVLNAVVTQASTACNRCFGLQLTTMQFIVRPLMKCV